MQKSKPMLQILSKTTGVQLFRSYFLCFEYHQPSKPNNEILQFPPLLVMTYPMASLLWSCPSEGILESLVSIFCICLNFSFSFWVLGRVSMISCFIYWKYFKVKISTFWRCLYERVKIQMNRQRELAQNCMLTRFYFCVGK